ncbi:MAG: plasmid mobilization protein [Lachnospiraceae bacterium]
MTIENKNCTMNFRCTNEQKEIIMELAKASNACSKSEYILNCCLYGTSDHYHQILVGVLSGMEELLIRLKNENLKKKEYIRQAEQELKSAWSTLRK